MFTICTGSFCLTATFKMALKVGDVTAAAGIKGSEQCGEE
jgi:hypothetical protein